MITIHKDIEQGTDAWLRARAGIPTSSEFSTVMAKGKQGGPSITRKKYLFSLASEVLTGEPSENYSNFAMERGKIMEAEARDLYTFQTDAVVERVGFIKHEVFVAGCSPDGLIGDDGMIEIKTKAGHLQLECLLNSTLPPEHKAQVQGALWITGRSWIDFVSYWPKLPLFVVRVVRDEEYISAIADAVVAFNLELAELVEKFK